MKRKGLWITLFVLAALLIGGLATGWNVVLVRDYYRFMELAREMPHREGEGAPWIWIVIGTLGFVGALAAMIIFFIRLLREMRLNQLQSEFLAAVTHELKTPIAAIELSASLIRQGDLSAEETQKLWDSHSQELARLRQEVEALLEAARWQTGHDHRPEQVRLRLESWLGESIERWRMILGPSSTLERQGDALEVDAWVDIKSLNLIADNLLDNARKFARGAPHVVIRTRVENGRWQIQVEDQGWGFPPSESKKIFGRFHRARSGAPHAIPGTGLGLFIAKTASQSLGIRLHGESPGKGMGAVFTLEGTAAHA